MRRKLSGLYGITDPALLPDSAALIAAVAAALKGGMRVLQYRAKSLKPSEQLQQATALKALCHRHDALFIINDDVGLAKAVDADGVHLGRNDADITSARRQLGAAAIIGCSCYNQLELAITAQQQGADYVAFGRFFPSLTKPEATPADPALLWQARRELEIPLCAIGGITVQNAGELIAQGADMLAVIHDLFSAQDIYRQSQLFNRLFSSNATGFCVE